MPVKSNGTVNLTEISNEFGGNRPHSLSQYYRGGSRVPNSTTNIKIAASGPISFSSFYGAANSAILLYEIIGGGGGGGAGAADRQPRQGTFAPSGVTSTIIGPGLNVQATGGAGGENHIAPRRNPWRGIAGASSLYGTGGAAGFPNSAGGNATGFGAGGGGGGGDEESFFDNSGAGGGGGNAGTRIVGSFEVVLDGEKLFRVNIGAAGSGDTGASYRGGNGSPGYAKLTFNSIEYIFTSNGTLSIPSGLIIRQ